MRRFLLTFILLLVSVLQSGFMTGGLASNASIAIINRGGKITARITDGDTISLQIKLSQKLTQQTSITFTLDDQDSIVGNCVVPTDSDTCQTEAFPSLGWHWGPGGVEKSKRVVNAYENGNSLLGQSEPLEVRARPVVMVHGFISSWDAWKPYLGPDGFLSPIGIQGFAVGDGQVEGVMNTGALTNPAGRTNTIAQNAEIEGQYIDGVKKATGAEMVDLVVHSMGGMISRYYIDRVMQERDVAQLIMLGSPMGGSDCSVLPAALGFYLPASIEIRQSYMRDVFNNQIVHRQGVEFYDLGGTPILEPFKSPCTDVPNDTVVSFGSINAIDLKSEKMDVIHSELTYSPLVFEKFVQPLLQKNAGTFTVSSDPQEAAVKSESLQFTRVYTGHVDAGGSTELTINIDANVTVASFALFDATRSIAVSMTGASGKVIPLDTEKNGFIQVDDPSSMIYLGYGFPNPKPGIWKVAVLATDKTPASGVDFAVSVYFVGGAILSAQSSTLIPKLGEQVELNANVLLDGKLLDIKQAQAVIRNPDGGVEKLDFLPGAKIAAKWTPKISGAHGIDIIVTSLASDGAPVERTAFLAVDVQPNPGKLQVTGNLVMVIGLIVFLLAIIGITLTRFVRKIMRRKTSQ
jgi:pimeloyl-ACP methyl ester carboxylesterase